jgi:hypothetical protein
LGYLFNEELVTLQSMIAAAGMLTGVYFINTAKSRNVVVKI